ncbi:MAG: DUF2953 domain-containing protein [Clostridia bacterium]|nr:DUF2953 domain-containing protein [Clostridia bacterium]
MIFLYILLGLIALMILLLLVPIKVRLRVREDGALQVRAYASVIPVYTQPPKEKPFRVRDYTPRAMAKKEKKKARMLARQRKKVAKRTAKKPQAPVKKPTLTLKQKVAKLTDTLSLITSLIDALHERLFRSTHIHVHRLAIRIGTDDAAKTALLYGVICPAAELLLEALHHSANLHLHHPEQMSVQPDFVNNTFHIELDIRLQMRVVHALSLGLRALIHIISHKQSRHVQGAAHRLPNTPGLPPSQTT